MDLRSQSDQANLFSDFTECNNTRSFLYVSSDRFSFVIDDTRGTCFINVSRLARAHRYKISWVNMKQSQSPISNQWRSFEIGKWEFSSVHAVRAVTQRGDGIFQRRVSFVFLAYRANTSVPRKLGENSPRCQQRDDLRVEAIPTSPSPSSLRRSEVTSLKLNFTDPFALPPL